MMPVKGDTLSWGTGNEGPDWAETGGTGPDVTGTTADGVPAITGA